MNILLTNDDGILSPGIRILAPLLEKRELLAATFAPDRERSGVGHAMTITRPVHARRLSSRDFPTEKPAYACDGTPTDCVTLALESFFPDADFVVSGINQGANLGDDITYSGTVCAALEGVIFGIGAMAVSLCFSYGTSGIHNETAASVALAILEWVQKKPLPAGVMLNVNVPNIPFAELKGIRFTRKGERRYEDKLHPMKDPQGRHVFWIGGSIRDCLSEGSDVLAVSQRYASVTPIHLDMTHFDSLRGYHEEDIGEKIWDALLSGNQ